MRHCQGSRGCFGSTGLCSCWLWPAFLSLWLRHIQQLPSKVGVPEHTVRHDPVRSQVTFVITRSLDTTNPLENQCWVSSTCCCCLGWNSLIFSSSDIPPTAASHTGWQNQRDGKDGACTKILHCFSACWHLFALILPPVVLHASEMLYTEIVTAAI